MGGQYGCRIVITVIGMATGNGFHQLVPNGSHGV